MKFAGVVAVALLMWAANAISINAAESVMGRWAVDDAACAGFFGTPMQSPLVVSERALRWSSDACRIERSYKTGDTVHIQARCWGEGGDKSIPVSLRPQGGKLLVTWDRGARGTLRRCP
ncbi:MAG: hypothetical protein HY244_03650 [Rhizobiales bacterium]|nr:hypothetical protein [Hyphomicrobiales bacterium]